MLRLGFDVDEVVSLTASRIIEYLNNKYNLDIKEFYDYKIEHHPHIKENGDNDLIVADLKERIADMDFYKNCLPDKDGANTIRLLKRKGHKIYFISARPAGGEEKTAIWLRKNKIPFDDVKHTTRIINKGMIGRFLNLDFYIDDQPKEIETMLRYKNRWNKGLAILDKPWNRDYNNDKVVRIKSWYDVLRQIGV